MRVTRRAMLATATSAAVSLGIVRSGVRAATTTIRVGATGNDTAAQVYYAEQLGYFRDHGLSVEITVLRNGAAEAAAIAGGALDIGEQNIVSMSRAHERGIPFKFIAPAGEYVASASTTSLVVAKSGAVRNARDLEGKTIAVNALGDLTQIGTTAWLQTHGADASKAKFIEITAPEIGAAVARGTIDAGVIPEPALTVAEDTGAIRVLAQPYDAIADRFMINGWFANADWIKNNGAAAHGFAQAMSEAARWGNAHHKESAAILVARAKGDPAVVGRMRRAKYSEGFDLKSMQAVIETIARYKGIAKSFSAGELIVAYSA